MIILITVILMRKEYVSDDNIDGVMAMSLKYHQHVKIDCIDVTPSNIQLLCLPTQFYCHLWT